MDILITGGRVINPANNTDRIMDIGVKDGKITGAAECAPNARIIDASGKWVLPGFIDLHVHLREPGYEYKETISTGAAAAARGGYTTICCMANTDPVADSVETIKYIQAKATSAAVRVLPFASVTKGMNGTEPTDMQALAEAGAAGFSEDGKGVADAALFFNALKTAGTLGLAVYDHCEDAALSRGFLGTPRISEEINLARDILLAEAAEPARLHICHLSTAAGVRLVREAKARGVRITCEAAPHHFSLCEEDAVPGDGDYKMNPPLRGRVDMEALRNALRDGTIDCIATDHAPHSREEKTCLYAHAANGVVGLETAFAASYTALVMTGTITPKQLIAAMTVKPARILGIGGGTLSVGAPADITVADPAVSYIVDPAGFISMGRSSAFKGRRLYGCITATICGGELVYGG